jgi:hypothetical protein
MIAGRDGSSMLDDPGLERGATTAKVYYADDLATELDAAFVVEGWEWVVGFDQVGTDGEDYVSIPADRVIAVRSPTYCAFTRDGRRGTAYGVSEDELAGYVDRLPL